MYALYITLIHIFFLVTTVGNKICNRLSSRLRARSKEGSHPKLARYPDPFNSASVRMSRHKQKKSIAVSVTDRGNSSTLARENRKSRATFFAREARNSHDET